jgi:hypothetical protein
MKTQGETMDDALAQIFVMPNLIFMLAIWILVWMQRKAISLLWKKAEDNKFYRELFLPMGPIGTGGILAMLVKQFPYPAAFTTFGARVIFGSVLGLISAHAYKMIKSFMAKNGDTSDDSTP